VTQEILVLHKKSRAVKNFHLYVCKMHFPPGADADVVAGFVGAFTSLAAAFVREDAAERVSDMIYAAGEFILYF
jgi:hypothetical protein